MRREYFAALAADEEQVAAIRQALMEADLSPALHSAMERAFGGNIRTEVENAAGPGWAARHEFYEPHMRAFLERGSRRASTTMTRTLAAALTLLVASGSAQHMPGSAPVQNAMDLPAIQVIGRSPGAVLRQTGTVQTLKG